MHPTLEQPPSTRKCISNHFIAYLYSYCLTDNEKGFIVSSRSDER